MRVILLRNRRLLGVVVVVAVVVAARAFWQGRPIDPALVAVVQRGTLTARLTTAGVLRPVQSLTYRSPLLGREVEILELAVEGTRVAAGDLLVRLDSTEIEHDIERLRQELRQLQFELQVAHGERQEAEAAVKMASEGEGALSVEEARTRLQVAQRKAERLRHEYDDLKPLMEKGFITRAELARTESELEQSEEEFALARRRHDVTVQLTHPREKQRAAVQLAQKQSQLENLVGRVQESAARLQQLVAMAKACTVYARHPGLVVHEPFLNASPRRKVRVGDRVSASQGIVTIPEVSRMMVETSVTEAEVHRVRAGQPAAVRLEAFPDLRLTGRVIRVGTLASSAVERALDEKRFDLIVEVDPTDAELRPEMSARVDVTLGVRENVLLVPVDAVFEDQGTFVVHVEGWRGVETRRVDLGESDDRVVVVMAGVRENERVALSVPSNRRPSASPSRPPGTGPIPSFGNAGATP